jgi:hypothetical protein
MKISATQIEKKIRCERLIGFQYVDGFEEPPTAKKDFGLGVHARQENWLGNGIYPDESPEGLVARQGIRNGWLPAPSKDLLIEHEFVIPMNDDLDLGGRIDCVVPGKVPIVIDHKTTSNLSWAKTEKELREDTQAILYSVFAALHYNAALVRARWIYYSASNPKKGDRKPAGAKGVEVIFNVASLGFLQQWDRICQHVQRIVEIRTRKLHGKELPANSNSCGAYGGCYCKEMCQLSGIDKLASAIRQEQRNHD